jgi:hypothetical protein
MHIVFQKDDGLLNSLNTKKPTKSEYPFFIDWITIEQTHWNLSEPLPIISDGLVESWDLNGEKEWQVIKSKTLEGSHSSKIQVRCDGNTVRLSGNVGRFGRSNNLFGYSFDEIIQKTNQILDFYGLPHFTAGESSFFQSSKTLQYSGAKVTRLDLTANYSTGSEQDACDFLRWLSSQQASRVKTGVYGEGATVDFGRGSRNLCKTRT